MKIPWSISRNKIGQEQRQESFKEWMTDLTQYLKMRKNLQILKNPKMMRKKPHKEVKLLSKANQKLLKISMNFKNSQ
jgi:hypothetical protein